MKKRNDVGKLISGQASRKYRRYLAGLCDNPKDTTQTLKFKLERAADSKVPSFNEFRDLYDTLESCREGGLIYFLFTLINSGFRIFPSFSETKSFASKAQYRESDFSDAVNKAFQTSLPNLTPAKIFTELTKIPRKVNGKDVSFSSENVKSKLTKVLIAGTDNQDVGEVFEKFAQALVGRFKDWKEVAANVSVAVGFLDDTLKSYGEFPTLQSMLKKQPDYLPANSTIAFDSAALAGKPDEEINHYVAVSLLLRDFDWQNDSKPSKFVKSRLTTESENGLSWLFSKGLEIFKATPVKKSSNDKASLQELFQVPDDKIDQLVWVKSAAEKIKAQNLIYRSGSELPYKEFRRSFGGHIDSWVSNYINRLVELNLIIESLPEKLELPDCFRRQNGDSFIEYSGLSETELSELLISVNRIKEKAKASLDLLCGKVDRVPSRDDIKLVKELSSLINRFASIRESLENSAQQASKDENSIWKDLSKQLSQQAAWQKWKELKNLPKLNAFSGGVPNEEESLNELIELNSRLIADQKSDYLNVMDWAEKNNALQLLIELQITKEAEAIKKRPSCNMDAKVQAARKIFNDICREARKSQDGVSIQVRDWIKEKNIFENEKDFNRYFFNFLGSLYVSPFSQSRHLGYSVNPSAVSEAENLWKSFGELLTRVEIQMGSSSEEVASMLRFKRLWMNKNLSRITKKIPKEVAALSMPQEQKEEALSYELTLLFNQNQISPSDYIKGFNTYTSLISGINTQLRRESFYLRTKFSWIKNTSLSYVPKDKVWRIPERYRKSEKWEKLLVSDVFVFDDNGAVDTLATFEKIVSKKDDLVSYREILQQLPHDWVYISPFCSGNEADAKAINIDKKGSNGMVCTVSRVCRSDCLRLIGPSSFKTRLDQLYLQPKEVKTGDMMLLVDQPVKQEIADNRISLTYSEPIITLAIPLTISGSQGKKEEESVFKNIVAIDQGEAGIAYAVFSLSDAGKKMAVPIETGTIRVTSIRHLIKNVGKYRSGNQAVAKFNQRFDSSLFNLRENVTGDVIHAIVGLMKKFDAFPILEYQVKNLESGSKQLSLVYKAVNSHFLGSKIAGQDSLRKQTWFNSNRWTLNNFERLITDKSESDGSKKKQNYEVLRVWPGASVNASYTSRICSCCGKNISEYLIKASKDSAYKKVRVEKDGIVDLYGEKIQLFGPDKDKPAKFYARRNERVQLKTPISEGELSFSDFEKLVKRNLRRAPLSKQSRDTTQSRFFCVFKDCKIHNSGMHADENAAINIGRRFLENVRKAK